MEQMVGCLGSLCGAAVEGVDGEQVTGCLVGLCQILCGAACQTAGVEGEDAEGAVGCLG